MIKKRKAGEYLVAGLLILLGAGFFAAQVGSPDAVADQVSETERLAAPYEIESGRQVVVAFIGASFCGAHREKGYVEAVREAKELLAERARRAGKMYHLVGVSVDWDPEIGREFLRPFGPFHEISVGGNWLNLSSLWYIEELGVAYAGVPQLIVMEREVVADTVTGRIGATRGRLVTRKVGADELIRWVEDGLAIGNMDSEE